MAFPEIITGQVVEWESTGTATTHDVAIPTGLTNDNLLFMAFWCNGSSGGSTEPSGWTSLASSGGFPRTQICYKKIDGTEGSTATVSIAAAAREAAAVTFEIGPWHGTTAPEEANDTSTGTAPNSPSLNPANWDVEDTLWLAVMIADHDSGGETVDALPSGYTAVGEQINSGLGVVSVASKESAAASEDPGAWTISNSQQNIAYTIAIRPGSSGAGNGGGGGSSLNTLTLLGVG